MKPLIAITCIAVLAATGYYFFREYRDYQASIEAELTAADLKGKRHECQGLINNADWLAEKFSGQPDLVRTYSEMIARCRSDLDM